MAKYAAQLDEIAEGLPKEALRRAYYPFAGIDFYWLRIFDHITFEDLAYDKLFARSMWWPAKMYTSESRIQIIQQLKSQNVVPSSHVPAFRNADGDLPLTTDTLLQSGITLIVKGGHSVLPFLHKRYGEGTLPFSAAVFASPADDPEKLKEAMSKRGYRLDRYIKGEPFYAPYAMGLHDIYVFIKSR